MTNKQHVSPLGMKSFKAAVKFLSTLVGWKKTMQIPPDKILEAILSVWPVDIEFEQQYERYKRRYYGFGIDYPVNGDTPDK